MPAQTLASSSIHCHNHGYKFNNMPTMNIPNSAINSNLTLINRYSMCKQAPYHNNNNNNNNNNEKQKYQPSQPELTEQQQQEVVKKHEKTKKRVTFNRNATLRPIPHVYDMPPEVIRDTYMSPEDFVTIREDCAHLLHTADFTKEGYFLRGVDKSTWKYTTKRNEIHNKVHKAVEDIQYMERITGQDYSDLLAKTCSKYSEPAAVAAQMAAISDLFSAFRGTWTQRAIPTIKESALKHGDMTLA